MLDMRGILYGIVFSIPMWILIYVTYKGLVWFLDQFVWDWR